jgi:hypothetical protein
MFINIITPCSRPENLVKIAKSINIPKEHFRWIVVADMLSINNSIKIPEICELYFHVNPNSTSGNAQRNYAINMVKDGYIYFNDDDTILHNDLWENIKHLTNDFISFSQENKDGSLRLKGDNVRLNHIDSHNFLTYYDIIKDSRFKLDLYGADGYFAEECYSRSQNPIFINKALSTYNILK